MKMRSQKIETIRKKFCREWLLVAVDKTDELTAIPLTGQLLAHSPHRDEIYRLEMKYKRHTLTIYSEDGFPKGYAAAFYEKA
jgi:hypothetical protein